MEMIQDLHGHFHHLARKLRTRDSVKVTGSVTIYISFPVAMKLDINMETYLFTSPQVESKRPDLHDNSN